MFDIRQTETFARWLNALSDKRAVQKIAQRLIRVQSGLFGDVKSVGDGVSELRIDYGPVYRVYFTKRGRLIIVLLCGGDKQSQKHDISQAKSLARLVELER